MGKSAHIGHIAYVNIKVDFDVNSEQRQSFMLEHNVQA